MNFKDLFDKYLSNDVTDEEKAFVEQEIEKSKVISDYIAENTDLGLNISLNEEVTDEQILEMKKIKQDVKKKNFRIIRNSVTAVVALIVLFQLAIVPLLNSFFYNPNKKTYSDYRSDLTFSLATFSKLHFPNYYTNGVIVENTGVGEYSLTAIQHNLFTWKQEYFYGNITRGNIDFDLSFWNVPAVNIFSRDSVWRDQSEKAIKELNQLPSHMYLQAEITFKKDLSMVEFTEIFKEFEEEIYITWVGVRGTDQRGQTIPPIGFAPAEGGPYFEKTNDYYPYYHIYDYIHNTENLTAEVFENHFKDLLQFQLDNSRFLDKLDWSGYGSTPRLYYREVLNYVNENGVKTHGMIVQGDPENILRLTELGVFQYIRVTDIRVAIPF